MEHGTKREQAGDARIMQPAVPRQDRKSRIGEGDQQVERSEPAPLPWGERAWSPFPARIYPQRRGRPLGVPSKPWQPVSRGLGEIAPQPHAADDDTESNRNDPGN